MAITVGTLTISALQELPYSHGGDALTGRTVRRWPVRAVLTPADWLTLDGIYTTWRASRLADPDTMVSLAVGTTVTTSGAVYGLSWSNVAAWFSAPPVATATGGMLVVNFELIDAAQQLAVMLREDEINQSVSDNESTYGTYALGGVTLNLTGASDGFDDAPRMELAATGTHVIRGPLLASKMKRIQGWTNATGAAVTIRSWYETQLATTPAVGAWWPVSAPTIEQTPVIVNGARVTRYLVTVDLKQVR